MLYFFNFSFSSSCKTCFENLFGLAIICEFKCHVMAIDVIGCFVQLLDINLWEMRELSAGNPGMEEHLFLLA